MVETGVGKSRWEIAKDKWQSMPRETRISLGVYFGVVAIVVGAIVGAVIDGAIRKGEVSAVPTYPRLLVSNENFDISVVAPRYDTGYNLVTLKEEVSSEKREVLWTEILSSLDGLRKGCTWAPTRVHDKPDTYLVTCR